MPFRYLGVPLAAQKLKISHYVPFVDKVAAYINAWSSATLSYAGRTELIRAVLQGVECFWLSILSIPSAVIVRIVRLCRVFLWNSKHPLVPWKDVCLPKKEGGLGFKDIKMWNLALLARTLWDIHQKESLWVQRDDSPLLKQLRWIRDKILLEAGSNDAAISRLSCWTNNGRFSISSAYNYFRDKGPLRVWASNAWHPSVVPKHAFALWLAAKSRLLTRDRLLYLDINRSCVLCGTAVETNSHLFFQCPFNSSVWGIIREWLGISRLMSTIPSALKWLKKKAREAKVKRIALACTVYYLWNIRNRKIFEDHRPCIDTVIRKIKTQVYKDTFSLYPHVLIYFEALFLGQ
ncbi:uncharacterized protein LOC127791595 [Diospyros lotus]|uniref:uncharacterized protein LOC127791595 n=1 Tax=Diospyros lotus TaxID=55363 RepID=UPI002253F7C6|nr:uncharacterized protein LOC127791595 [Diospyros lotus]